MTAVSVVSAHTRETSFWRGPQWTLPEKKSVTVQQQQRSGAWNTTNPRQFQDTTCERPRAVAPQTPAACQQPNGTKQGDPRLLGHTHTQATPYNVGIAGQCPGCHVTVWALRQGPGRDQFPKAYIPGGACAKWRELHNPTPTITPTSVQLAIASTAKHTPSHRIPQAVSTFSQPARSSPALSEQCLCDADCMAADE